MIGRKIEWAGNGETGLQSASSWSEVKLSNELDEAKDKLLGASCVSTANKKNAYKSYDERSFVTGTGCLVIENKLSRCSHK